MSRDIGPPAMSFATYAIRVLHWQSQSTAAERELQAKHDALRARAWSLAPGVTEAEHAANLAELHAEAERELAAEHDRQYERLLTSTNWPPGMHGQFAEWMSRRQAELQEQANG